MEGPASGNLPPSDNLKIVTQKIPTGPIGPTFIGEGEILVAEGEMILPVIEVLMQGQCELVFVAQDDGGGPPRGLIEEQTREVQIELRLLQWSPIVP